MTEPQDTDTTIIGTTGTQAEGVKIIGGGGPIVKGVKTLDKNSKTEQPAVTVTVGEGDSE